MCDATDHNTSLVECIRQVMFFQANFLENTFLNAKWVFIFAVCTNDVLSDWFNIFSMYSMNEACAHYIMVC